MFYDKNNEELTAERFANPDSTYRGAPFWAWNTDLKKDELIRQIGELKKMGFGGFFMHTRAGMNTPYLGDEFMELIRACRDEAKKHDMLAYLYDEDRWPSGAAGGIVTEKSRLSGTVSRIQSRRKRKLGRILHRYACRVRRCSYRGRSFVVFCQD